MFTLSQVLSLSFLKFNYHPLGFLNLEASFFCRPSGYSISTELHLQLIQILSRKYLMIATALGLPIKLLLL